MQKPMLQGKKQLKNLSPKISIIHIIGQLYSKTLPVLDQAVAQRKNYKLQSTLNIVKQSCSVHVMFRFNVRQRIGLFHQHECCETCCEGMCLRFSHN